MPHLSQSNPVADRGRTPGKLHSESSAMPCLSPSLMVSVGKDPLAEVCLCLAQCTAAHRCGDMEAFHSAWHAEVRALMSINNREEM